MPKTHSPIQCELSTGNVQNKYATPFYINDAHFNKCESIKKINLIFFSFPEGHKEGFLFVYFVCF